MLENEITPFFFFYFTRLAIIFTTSIFAFLLLNEVKWFSIFSRKEGKVKVTL